MRHFKMGLMAMAMILAAVSCGTRGQKKNAAAEAPETKAAEAVQEPETYSQAIDRYLTEVIGAQYGSGEVCIPYHDYISADESRQDDIQVWGSYWVDNYNVVGDTLMFVSGGSHPGKMHVKQDEAGHFTVTGFLLSNRLIAILLDAQAGARLDTTPWMYRPDREERRLNLPKGESELFTELYEQKVRK